MRINAMLGKRMSLEDIAEQLNAKSVPTIHGTRQQLNAAAVGGRITCSDEEEVLRFRLKPLPRK
jgi:hypothetical protein